MPRLLICEQESGYKATSVDMHLGDLVRLSVLRLYNRDRPGVLISGVNSRTAAHKASTSWVQYNHSLNFMK